MYGQTDRSMEFLPILQDFVPYLGRCPATLCNCTASKKQGKGIADLMMPFGVSLTSYDPSRAVGLPAATYH